MANKRARDRQLAKLAARRQAERRAMQRRRSIITSTVVVLIVIALGATGISLIAGGSDTAASPSAPPPTSSPNPEACRTDAPPTAGETKPTFDAPPKMTIDPKTTYTATMKTSCGTVVMKLDPKTAPIGVNSFVFLAKQGFYDGLTFHRIVSGFMIQGGDPAGDGTGSIGYQFDNEISKKVTFDDGGILAYANAGPDTNGSGFFITLGPTPQLDPTDTASYTIFGKVTKGMDVVQRIGAVPTVDNGSGEVSSPTTPVYIDSVKIKES